MPRVEEYLVKVILLSPTRIGGDMEGNRLGCMARLVVRHVEFEKTQGQGPAPRLSKAKLERLPVIPGSSLKGLLRAASERIAATLYNPAGADDVEDIPGLLAALHHQPSRSELRERTENGRLLLSSVLHAKPKDLKPLGAGRLLHGEVAELLERHGLSPCLPDAPEDAPLDWSYEAFASRYCPVCLLYGSQHQAGAVRVLDALPVGSVRFTTLTHVSINRQTRTKAEGKLFQEEAIPAGTVFTTRLYIVWPLPSISEENTPCNSLYNAALKEAKKLWKKTLEYIHAANIISLGSGRSRGLGKAAIIITPHTT